MGISALEFPNFRYDYGGTDFRARETAVRNNYGAYEDVRKTSSNDSLNVKA